MAFTDDDCRPAPGWLEALLEDWAQIDNSSMVVLQGRTEPDPDESHLLYGLSRSQTIIAPSPSFQACNIAYPRALLEREGGFDDSYDFGGEDTDLGVRAMKAGAPQRYVDRAVVWHAVHARNLPEALRDAQRWNSLPLLFARHPELRRHLYLGVFWKPAHAKFLLAAVGLWMWRYSKIASVFATLPYLVSKHDPTLNITPRRILGLAAALPSELAVDGTETLATLVHALRKHTILI